MIPFRKVGQHELTRKFAMASKVVCLVAVSCCVIFSFLAFLITSVEVDHFDKATKTKLELSVITVSSIIKLGYLTLSKYREDVAYLPSVMTISLFYIYKFIAPA